MPLTCADVDFLLDDVTWKVLFGETSRLCKCIGPMGLLAIRASLFTFWCSFWLWRLIGGNLHAKYLTHWTATFELVYLFFAALSTLMAVTTFHGIPDGKGSSTPWFARIAWAMQGTALVISTLVLLLYWVLDFAFECQTEDGCPVIDFSNVSMHGINAVIMWIDGIMWDQPFYLSHIFMPVIYSAIYFAWNVCWSLANGEPVYGILDWENNTPRALTMAASVLFVVLPLFYGLFFWYVRRTNSSPKADETEVAELRAGEE